MTLWNRTVEKANAIIADLSCPWVVVKALDLETLRGELNKDDVVVSMLPAQMHPEIAEICLDVGAHLVTSSYISEAMQALDERANEAGIALVNECGLDPGLDHLLAHKLVAEYRESGAIAPGNRLSFKSYCGGFPKAANDFKYKFSWSPIAVLRALKSPARAIVDGEATDAPHPWKALSTHQSRGEHFEVYPNRDATPYLTHYRFDPEWRVDEFVRGTLRLGGWSKAWEEVFQKVEHADAAQLETLSDHLWSQYAYDEGEADRVVLTVGLSAKNAAGEVVFSRAYVMDEAGTEERSAMAHLVSVPVSFAVEWVLAGKVQSGVQGPPEDSETIETWLARLQDDGVVIHEVKAD
jgi:saccharopine dehydrogenase (NADP+, L-glutamate forming)